METKKYIGYPGDDINCPFCGSYYYVGEEEQMIYLIGDCPHLTDCRPGFDEKLF